MNFDSIFSITIVTILTIPIWFSFLRIVFAFFRPGILWTKVFFWFYFIALVWSGGGVAYQWYLKIPSGIGYGFVLLTGWSIMLVGMVLDPLIRSKLPPLQ